MRKTFLIDTNVLLDDPDAIYKFKDNEVVIDFRVLLELDSKKNEPGILGKNARQVARNFIDLFELGDPKTGVTVNKEGGTLRFYDWKEERSKTIKFLQDALTSRWVEEPDLNHKLDTDTHLYTIARVNDWTLVTKDKYLIVRARLSGAKVENYQNDTVVVDYIGHINASASADLINHLYKAGVNEKVSVLEVFDSIQGLYPNQCVTLTCPNTSQSALCILDSKVKHISLISTYNSVTSAAGIKPLNAEQRYALHLLNDPNIKLVTISGATGSGKTLLSLAGGVQQQQDGIFEDTVVTRKEVTVGGERAPWLPGDEKAKQDPWLKGIYACLNQIAKAHQPNLDKAIGDMNKPYDYYLMTEIVKPETLLYVRGVTYHNSLILVTEGQNCHRDELKTIITRAGKKAKVVIEGDPNQVDAPYPKFLDKQNNGLTDTINRWKGSAIYGHITLFKTERSELAREAEQRYSC